MAALNETYRYIVRTPNIRGGKAHLENTRVGVHDVIGLLRRWNESDLLRRINFAWTSNGGAPTWQHFTPKMVHLAPLERHAPLGLD